MECRWPISPNSARARPRRRAGNRRPPAGLTARTSNCAAAFGRRDGLLADLIAKQNINRNQLTIHADNGSSMASKPVAFLLADLGVTKSHSRPHTSSDNHMIFK